MTDRQVPWFAIGWSLLLIVFAWLALASWWSPDGAWWLPITFTACAVVCAGNLFWTVKHRRSPQDR
jgi:Na+-driven multidrug efflux pump